MHKFYRLDMLGLYQSAVQKSEFYGTVKWKRENPDENVNQVENCSENEFTVTEQENMLYLHH